MELRMSRIIIALSLVALFTGGCSYLKVNQDGTIIDSQDYIIKYTEAPGGIITVTAAPSSWFSWKGVAEVIGAVAPIIGPFLGPDGQPAYLVHGLMVPAIPPAMQYQGKRHSQGPYPAPELKANPLPYYPPAGEQYSGKQYAPPFPGTDLKKKPSSP
jgi:hypothetical protein